ncbi:MAG: hypothetical protein JWN67_2478 [Actinomycetia bacterium]|nr:hypothetical protein [Actinomycetes bacterium]
MSLNDYSFRSEWRIDAPPADVYAVLLELPDYPAWWPEVRTAEEVGSQAFRLTCRSTLPYDLVFTTTQARQDPDAGVLEANLVGDLDGFSRWTITADGAGTLAVFEEEVEATKALLRTLAPVARPAFKANHSLMMRHGQAGLRTYVAGYRLGRRG